MPPIATPQAGKKIGDADYVNQNCWLARNLGYPPSQRCRYCQSKFNYCLFFQYLVISILVTSAIAIVSYLVDGKIDNLLIISVFALIIIYGYYFSRSTESIIEANFLEHKAKTALEALNGNLQKKVDEQTEHLKVAYETEKLAKEELVALDEQKDQFLLTVQHHLRTPLTSMMGYTDLMLDGTFGKVPKKIGTVVEKMGASISGLIKMVNDFLDVTQFKMGKSVISLNNNVNLCSIFSDIAKDIGLEAEAKGLFLKIEEPSTVCLIKADATVLRAAFLNILDNAVKYTDKGGITVSTKVEDGNVIIQIKDTGMGISKERLPKIFDIAFERSEEAKKKFSTGRGIGLYLSGQIIKAHFGKIWVESEGEGKGSTFNILLPIEPLAEKAISKK